MQAELEIIAKILFTIIILLLPIWSIQLYLKEKDKKQPWFLTLVAYIMYTIFIILAFAGMLIDLWN